MERVWQLYSIVMRTVLYSNRAMDEKEKYKIHARDDLHLVHESDNVFFEKVASVRHASN